MSIARARALRRQLSPAEARLWNALRTEPLKPWHFRRQMPVGPFYADYDARRDAFLRSKGYRVLRVTTSDVLNRLDSVHAAILAALSGTS